MIHMKQSDLSGRIVKIMDDIAEIGGKDFCVEDWWDRVAGKSWMFCDGNPACLDYAIRTGIQKRHVPSDNEVLYGKIGMSGKLVHVSELEKV